MLREGALYERMPAREGVSNEESRDRGERELVSNVGPDARRLPASSPRGYRGKSGPGGSKINGDGKEEEGWVCLKGHSQTSETHGPNELEVKVLKGVYLPGTLTVE